MKITLLVFLSILVTGCIPGFPNPGLLSDPKDWIILSDEEVIESLNEDSLITSELNTNVGTTFVCCEDSFAPR